MNRSIQDDVDLISENSELNRSDNFNVNHSFFDVNGVNENIHPNKEQYDKKGKLLVTENYTAKLVAAVTAPQLLPSHFAMPVVVILPATVNAPPT